MMHKTTIYLEDDIYERIRQLAQDSGRTQAAVIREALSRLATRGKRRPRSLGLGASGRPDLSDCTDELLDGLGDDS
jgi:hypothetical protein